MSVSQIELSLTPALYEWRSLKQGHTTVAVDVLRATTAICAAFQAGAECIVPLDSLEALEPYRAQGYLRAAERGGRKIGDAEYGYSTTNGTVSILRGGDADRTLVGCFANIDALSERLLAQPQDLVILCSGWKNDFSIEDTLFAGALCRRLLDSGLYTSRHDAVAMAVALWDACQGDPYTYSLRHASHVQRLIGFGAKADILFAFKCNTCPVVPQLNNGVLTCK